MRRIGVATFGRSDYSSCLPILRALQADPELELWLLVSGMHLAPEFGRTVSAIEADGFPIAERIEMLLSSDSEAGTATAIGLGTIGFARGLQRVRPEILLMVGDRLELLAAACAALPLAIPLAHVSGGDVTEGAVDNQIRHAISKMSHVHFVAMPEHADRLRQMGEEPWRIVVTGDPALDLLRDMTFLSRAELETRLGLALKPPLLLVAYHPTTLDTGHVATDVDTLLNVLAEVRGTLIFTYPNADPGNPVIIDRLREFTASRADTRLFMSLGQLVYFSLMAQADLMVGNSSSAIWEAPSFRLPAVDIGDRQKGRRQAGNVVHAALEAAAVRYAIAQALAPAFRAGLHDLQNPYGDGRAVPRIVETLKRLEGGRTLLQKRFLDATDRQEPSA